MSVKIGDFTEDSLLEYEFATFNADGAPIVLTGSPAVSIFVVGDTTEITGGITLTPSINSTPGRNLLQVDLDDNASYTNLTKFVVVFTAGTIDGQDIAGAILGEFSIGLEIAGLAAANTAQNTTMQTFIGDAFTEIKGATWDTSNSLEAISDDLTAAGFDDMSDDLTLILTRIGVPSTSLAVDIAANLTAIGNLNDPTAASIVSTLFGTETEDSETFIETLRLARSVLLGKSSKSSNDWIFRDKADSKNRVAIRTNASNERTTIVTSDGS